MPKNYTFKELSEIVEIDRDLNWLEYKFNSFVGNLNHSFSSYKIIEDVYRISGKLKRFPDIYSKPIESLNLIKKSLEEVLKNSTINISLSESVEEEPPIDFEDDVPF
jgi:hypothetical protein